jgi:hypothetical protein
MFAACFPVQIQSSASPAPSPSAANFSSAGSSLAAASSSQPDNMAMEAEAMVIIKGAGGGIFADAQPVSSIDIEFPIQYLGYDAGSKSFTRISPENAEDLPKIDLYDASKYVGFEYLSDELNQLVEPSAYSPASAEIIVDGQSAYILVLNQANKGALTEQTETFITWLKTQGVL